PSFTDQTGAAFTFQPNSSSTVTFGGVFNSSDTVNVLSGKLQLSGGGTDSGSFQGAGTLIFGTGTHVLTASSAITTANVQFDAGGTRTVDGTFNPSGTSTFSGGTTTFDPVSTLLGFGNSLTVSGGSTTFNSGESLSVASYSDTGGSLLGSDDL